MHDREQAWLLLPYMSLSNNSFYKSTALKNILRKLKIFNEKFLKNNSTKIYLI